MIKKKNIIGEEIVCSYDSSNILASKYHSKSKKLTITFNRGTQYQYFGVDETEYKEFESAESQGKIFNSKIKSKDFEKIGDVDVDLLLEEINKGGEKVKTELDKDEKQLIVAMEAFLIYHNKKNDLSLVELRDLQYFLTKVINNKEK